MSCSSGILTRGGPSCSESRLGAASSQSQASSGAGSSSGVIIISVAVVSSIVVVAGVLIGIWCLCLRRSKVVPAIDRGTPELLHPPPPMLPPLRSDLSRGAFSWQPSLISLPASSPYIMHANLQSDGPASGFGNSDLMPERVPVNLPKVPQTFSLSPFSAAGALDPTNDTTSSTQRITPVAEDGATAASALAARQRIYRAATVNQEVSLAFSDEMFAQRTSGAAATAAQDEAAQLVVVERELRTEVVPIVESAARTQLDAARAAFEAQVDAARAAFEAQQTALIVSLAEGLGDKDNSSGVSGSRAAPVLGVTRARTSAAPAASQHQRGVAGGWK